MKYSTLEIVLSKQVASVLFADTRNKQGIFVNSIVFGSNTSDTEEEVSLSVGDVILSINNVNIMCLKLDYINETLSNVVHPVTVVVQRYQWDSDLECLLRDARLCSWIQQYCKMPHGATGQVSRNVETLIYLWSVLDYVRSIVSYQQSMSQPISDVGFIILSFRECAGYFEQAFLESIGFKLPADVQESLDCVMHSELEQLTCTELSSQLSIVLSSLNLWLTQELHELFFVPFTASVVASRMRGWLSSSPDYIHIILNDLLPSHDSSSIAGAWPFLYLFTITKCRHLARVTHTVDEIAATSLCLNRPDNTAELVEQAGWTLLKEGVMTALYKSEMYECLLSELRKDTATEAVTLNSGAVARLFRNTELPTHLTKIYVSASDAQDSQKASQECYTEDDEVCMFQYSTSITPDYHRSQSDWLVEGSYVDVKPMTPEVGSLKDPLLLISPLSSSSSYGDVNEAPVTVDRSVQLTTAQVVGLKQQPVKYEVVYRSAVDTVERCCIDAHLTIDQVKSCKAAVAESESDNDTGELSVHAAVLLPFCVPREDFLSLVESDLDKQKQVQLYSFVVTVRSGARLYGCSLLRKCSVDTLDWTLAINYAGAHKVLDVGKVDLGKETMCAAASANEMEGRYGCDSEPERAGRGASAASTTAAGAVLSDLGSKLYSGWQTALAVGSALPIVPIFKDEQRSSHPIHKKSLKTQSSVSSSVKQSHALHPRKQKEPKPVKHTRHYSYSSGIDAVAMNPQLFRQPKQPPAVADSREPAAQSSGQKEFDRTNVMGSCGICVFTRMPYSLDYLKRLMRKSYSECLTSNEASLTYENNEQVMTANLLSAALMNQPFTKNERDYCVVYECLSPRSIATLLLCCLLEYKIALHSTISLNAVVVVGEFLLACLQPLRYCHLYAPLLPFSVSLELLQCPTPFIIGVSSVGLAAVPSDVVVVDIDQDQVTVPPPLQSVLAGSGVRLEAALSRCLRKHIHTLENVIPDEVNAKSIDPFVLCQQFVDVLLWDVSLCVLKFIGSSGDEVVLVDELKFVKMKFGTCCCDVQPAFLNLWLRSQCFAEFIAEFIAEI